MATDGKYADVDLSNFKELKKLSGEKIRQARKALGLTQLEVATEMGGSLRWYRAIESGDPGIRLEDHLIALLRLGASTAHIAAGSRPGRRRSRPASTRCAGSSRPRSR